MSEDYRAGAEGPLDAFDEEVLALLRACYETMDPMPPTLVERTLHALALHRPVHSEPAGAAAPHSYLLDDAALEAGVVRLARQQSLEPVGARGSDAGVITFESENLTVMVRISRQGERVRLDGWLAPPGPQQVRLRCEREALDAPVDGEGRFVIDAAPRGAAQLIVRHGAPDAAGPRETVLVPAIVL